MLSKCLSFCCLFLARSSPQVSSLHGRHAPTYSYLLATRCSSVSLQALFGVPDVPEDLVPHGDDLPCIFKDEDGHLPEYTDARVNTSRAMVKAWTNFAKYLEVILTTPQLPSTLHPPFQPFPGQDPSPWPRGGVLVLQPQPRLITDDQDETYRGFMDRCRPDPSSDLTPSLHQAEAVGRALLAGQEEAVDPAGQQECLAHSLPFLCLKSYQLEVRGTTLVLLHQISINVLIF